MNGKELEKLENGFEKLISFMESHIGTEDEELIKQFRSLQNDVKIDMAQLISRDGRDVIPSCEQVLKKYESILMNDETFKDYYDVGAFLTGATKHGLSQTGEEVLKFSNAADSVIGGSYSNPGSGFTKPEITIDKDLFMKSGKPGAPEVVVTGTPSPNAKLPTEFLMNSGKPAAQVVSPKAGTSTEIGDVFGANAKPGTRLNIVDGSGSTNPLSQGNGQLDVGAFTQSGKPAGVSNVTTLPASTQSLPSKGTLWNI